MAELKISFQLSADGKNITVRDNTDWPTGGFERSALNLFLFAELFRHSSELVSITSPYDAKNVSSWVLANAKDGVYEFLMLALPDYNPLLPNQKNSLVLFEGKVYASLKDLAEGVTPLSPNCWKEIISIKDVMSLTSFPNSHFVIGHYFKDSDTNNCIGEKAIAYTKQDCGCKDKSSMTEDYYWTSLYHAAAVYAFGFGEYRESGEFLSMAIQRCGVSEAGKEPCNCH